MAEAGEASTGTQGALEGGAEREEGIFGRMVVVDCNLRSNIEKQFLASTTPPSHREIMLYIGAKKKKKKKFY